MLITESDSTTGSNNFDGSDGAGLICTGQGASGGGSRMILRQFGFYASSAVSTLELRLYNDSGTPVLMSTIVDQSTVTDYLQSDMNVIVPVGWALQVHTTGASAGGTAYWALELGGAV